MVKKIYKYFLEKRLYVVRKEKNELVKLIIKKPIYKSSYKNKILFLQEEIKTLNNKIASL